MNAPSSYKPRVPMHRSSRATYMFIAAGLMNILGITVFSKGFTNEYMTELSPTVFSRFGMVGVVLWGLAYLAVATTWRSVPALLLVFVVEKAVYVVSWFMWLASHGSEFGAIWERDPLTAAFFVIYGPNDLLFGLFFAWAAAKALTAKF